MILKYLLEKEFKQFFRNSVLPKMMFTMPMMAILIFPLAANFEIKNVKLSIVDNDKSSYSYQLINKIQSSGYFKITDISQTYTNAFGSIESKKADIILEIPPHFEKDLIREKKGSVLISANAVDAAKGGIGSSYLAGIIGEFSMLIQAEWMQNNLKLATSQIQIIPQYRFNPRLEYKIFMIPALMVMVMAMISGFLPALNIVGEKENGTIEQMNVTPVTKFAFILSKLIPFWAVGFVSLTVCFLIARLVYGLVPLGHVYTIYFAASFFFLAFSGFGLVISNYAKSVQQAMFMMFFFVLTFVFMSGLYTPIDNMPEWAKLVSNFSPLKYMIQILRLVYLKGSGVSQLAHQFISLLGFAIFFNLWAIYSYHKRS